MQADCGELWAQLLWGVGRLFAAPLTVLYPPAPPGLLLQVASAGLAALRAAGVELVPLPSAVAAAGPAGGRGSAPTASRSQSLGGSSSQLPVGTPPQAAGGGAAAAPSSSGGVSSMLPKSWQPKSWRSSSSSAGNGGGGSSAAATALLGSTGRQLATAQSLAAPAGSGGGSGPGSPNPSPGSAPCSRAPFVLRRAPDAGDSSIHLQRSFSKESGALGRACLRLPLQAYRTPLDCKQCPGSCVFCTRHFGSIARFPAWAWPSPRPRCHCPRPCSGVRRGAAAVCPGQRRVPRRVCGCSGGGGARGGGAAAAQRHLRHQLPRLHLAAAGSTEPGAAAQGWRLVVCSLPSCLGRKLHQTSNLNSAPAAPCRPSCAGGAGAGVCHMAAAAGRVKSGAAPPARERCPAALVVLLARLSRHRTGAERVLWAGGGAGAMRSPRSMPGR